MLEDMRESGARTWLRATVSTRSQWVLVDAAGHRPPDLSLEANPSAFESSEQARNGHDAEMHRVNPVARNFMPILVVSGRRQGPSARSAYDPPAENTSCQSID